MLNQMLEIARITVVLLLCIAAWFASILVALGDFQQRKWHGFVSFLWLAVVILLPLFGFALYWLVLRRKPHAPPDARVRLTAEYPVSNRQLPIPAPSSASQPSAYQLIVMEGPYLGSKYELRHLPMQIGRGADMPIALNADQNISRKHAELFVDASGTLHIRDLNSTQGTYVNGTQISESPLHPGDQLTLGLSVFLVTEGQA